MRQAPAQCIGTYWDQKPGVFFKMETECPRAGPVKVNPRECQVVQAPETAKSQSLRSAEAG